ncbi:hypothetical protein ACJJIW_08870 [Microbulbifer sp. JMSA004]|uniref:hypothetical protein n=1 Tax=unclassified Microbulbifer TaxID=2619833 RepID=UPI0024ADEDCC|nr:hypothetical protein [Microbulbifer sp. VAAF005]WHI45381.1 hypothetical protein P0078_16825 [Microbulbifer sp. VAAF005]
MENKISKKNIILVTAATAIGSALGSFAVKDLFKENVDQNDRLKKVAEETNKLLPMIIDSETRLDSTVGLNNTFTYIYTLTNYSFDEIDASTLEQNLSPKVLNNYCSSSDMKQFVDHGVTVNFRYLGKAGKQILNLSHQPSDCKNG